MIAELKEKARQQEESKRYHDFVKTLVQLGDEVTDPEEKVENYLRAADLYVNKFANQAEAVKAFEKVLEVDSANPAAVQYLRQMYEKRRDWEKLISLNLGEARRMENGPVRTQMFKEIAQLATERVKKPDVCIDLWAVVLENDTGDLDALNALSGLYERAREYEKLADVLEKLAENTYETKEKIELLNKLGQVAGDRLKDDARAVDAYRMLLTLEPDDRRAQEQLKKRYVTLGRWDDLEVFYAESGKWDEFIRVLESNESRATDNEQRIGMLVKIAELWMTQKGKPDRASRAYEKILSLDPNNVLAADRLIPIYGHANNPKGLTAAIEVKLAHVNDPHERLGLLRQVAQLYETRINDKNKAFERYLAAFEIAAADERSQADVERVAKQTGRWDELSAAYRAAISRSESERDAVSATALRLRLGRVLVEEVQRIDDALIEYRAVYESEPENTVALAALEQLYRHTAALARSARRLREEARAGLRPRRAKADSARNCQALRNRASGSESRDRNLPRNVGRRCHRRAGVGCARSPLSRNPGVGTLRGRSTPPDRARRQRGAADRSQVSARRTRKPTISATTPARSRTIARFCSSTPITPAHAPRSRTCSIIRSCGARLPRSSKTSTRLARTGTSSCPRWRSSPLRRPSRNARSRCCARLPPPRRVSSEHCRAHSTPRRERSKKIRR